MLVDRVDHGAAFVRDLYFRFNREAVKVAFKVQCDIHARDCQYEPIFHKLD